MGSSTTGSYIILSVVAAPALVQLGVPMVAAHLAVFYAACLSKITPPVCVSAFAGAAIAGSDPMRTGFAALKYDATLALMRSAEHTSELQSLMRISYAVFCLKKKKKKTHNS